MIERTHTLVTCCGLQSKHATKIKVRRLALLKFVCPVVVNAQHLYM